MTHQEAWAAQHSARDKQYREELTSRWTPNSHRRKFGPLQATVTRDYHNLAKWEALITVAPFGEKVVEASFYDEAGPNQTLVSGCDLAMRWVEEWMDSIRGSP